MKIGIFGSTDKTMKGTYEMIGDGTEIIEQYNNGTLLKYEQIIRAIVDQEEANISNLAGPGTVGFVGIPENVIGALSKLNLDRNETYTIN